MTPFKKFLLKENNVTSEIKLSDQKENFKPFTVSDDQHQNLKILVKAFLDSDKVPFPKTDGNSFTTIDKQKGETTPKLKKKSLYLTGGAVRDHLKNKTPRDYDLVTDATPAEIRLILKHAGFSENENSKKFFKAKKHNDKEYEFVITINGDQFELATFRKNHKGKIPDGNVNFSDLDTDAQRRDITINSMYIPLSTDNGPNSKLIDPHGGAHHLNNNEINFVGNPTDRIHEDPIRLLRTIRFCCLHGNNHVPDNLKSTFDQFKDLNNVDKKDIIEEFIKAIQHPDIDTKSYTKLLKNSGLLSNMFKNLSINDELPESKDKKLTLAYILKNNKPDDIKDHLKEFFDNEKIPDEVSYLVDLNNWAKNPNFESEKFMDLHDYLNKKSNFVPSLIRKWNNMNKVDSDTTDKFLDYDKFLNNI